MNWRRLSVPSPPCVQCDAAQNRSMMKALITSAETGEKRAETSPFSSRLIAIDPTATPTENKARNSVATCWLALNSFFTRGGNWLANMVPPAQTKEMQNNAQYHRHTRMPSRHTPPQGGNI